MLKLNIDRYTANFSKLIKKKFLDLRNMPLGLKSFPVLTTFCYEDFSLHLDMQIYMVFLSLYNIFKYKIQQLVLFWADHCCLQKLPRI